MLQFVSSQVKCVVCVVFFQTTTVIIFELFEGVSGAIYLIENGNLPATAASVVNKSRKIRSYTRRAVKAREARLLKKLQQCTSEKYA